MSLPGHRERQRRLRELSGRLDAELVEELRRSAESMTRRDPREAGRRAQLGIMVAESASDVRGRIGCLLERAKAAVTGGNAPLALSSVDEAAALSRELGDETIEAQADLLRLQPLISLERYAEART